LVNTNALNNRLESDLDKLFFPGFSFLFFSVMFYQSMSLAGWPSRSHTTILFSYHQEGPKGQRARFGLLH
jgi:hypothetical protein